MEISQQLHQSRERLKVEIDRCQALRTRERLLIQRTEAAFNRRVEVQTLVEKREMRMMELTHQRERLRRQAEAANLQKGDIQSKMTSQDAAETLTRRRAVRKIQSLMAEAETRRQELQERLCTTAGRRLQLEKTREELRQRSKVARGRLTLVLELPTISQLDQSTEDLHQHVESAGVARKRAEVQLERAQAGLTRLQTEVLKEEQEMSKELHLAHRDLEIDKARLASLTERWRQVERELTAVRHPKRRRTRAPQMDVTEADLESLAQM